MHSRPSPPRVHARVASVALALLAALLVAGCGSGGATSSDDGDGSGGSGSQVGQLSHVDGTIALAGEELTVTPTNGGAPIVLSLGPALERGTMQSLVASGAKARVFYTDGAEPIAAKVEAAPTVEDGAQTYDGQIVEVSSSSVTVDGDEGERTFPIQQADAAAFDLAHLKEHRAEGSAVRIYFRTDDGTEHAVAYEDA